MNHHRQKKTMKHIVRLIAFTSPLLLFSCPLLLFNGCVDYSDATTAVSVKVQLQMPAEFTKGSDFEGHTVHLSLNGTTTQTATTDANGMVEFSHLIPDVYDLSTSWDISDAEYESLTGEKPQGSGCTVSGSINSTFIKDEGSVITLPTNVAVKRDIVISKIASAGSKDQNNRYYMAGKYMELYNQSSDTTDISALYIGLLDSTNPQPFTLANLHDAYNDSVVLVKQVFQIPEGAKPIAPGQAVVLTNSATDHSDVSATEQDLRDADYEAKDPTGNTINNPHTPALLSIYSSTGNGATMNLVQGGPCGIIIFRTDEDIKSWQKTYAYGKTTGSQLYLLVPKRVILDGVDYMKNKPTGIDLSAKRLYNDIDAGFTHINAYNGWTGEVVYRRTAKVMPNGQKILTDTNNSSNDFKVSTTIKPREYDDEN
ncbi:MAG: DUF4876 domain-containing protein [Prevotella sp.]|nr:DUF4876 domain-containing protein [Prevotella sp.]